MGDDITIGVTEIVNNIEVTAQPNDQVIDVNVTDNSDEVTLNVTPNVIEVNINRGSSFARWGSIFGNLTDQADLTNALFNKADLVDGKVPSYQLPSFVDDVIEVANYAALPTVGEIGKIYITLDDNKIYRWSGSIYIEIASNQAIWGAITGTLTNQTDLVNALNLKADKTITITPNAPLTGGGDLSANRTISINQSGASSNGFLSSTDWNTFNNKQPALNGTGIVKSTSGVISYLTDNSDNWNTAFNDKINSASVSGTTTKTLTLTQQDGGTVTASWTDNNTGVWGQITGTLSNQTDLQTALNLKANDADVVKLTGNQTIAGVKTFTSQMNAAKIIMSNSGVDRSLELSNTGLGQSIYVVNSSLGQAISVINNGSGNGIQNFNNGNSGIGIISANSNTATGNLYQGNYNGSRVFSVGSEGNGYFTDSVRIANISSPSLSWDLKTFGSQFQIVDVYGNSTRFVISSTGNVGIGTTSPAELLDVRNTYREPTSGEFTQLLSSTSSQDAGRGGSLGFGGFTSGTSSFTSFSGIKGFKENGDGGNTAGALSFFTRVNGGAIGERMRITSGGVVCIGTSSPISSGTNTSTGATFANAYNWLAVTDSNYIQRSNNTNGGFFNFVKGSTDVGSITVSGTTTLYNVTSDYRLKEDFKNYSGLNLISKIKTYDYKWKASEDRMYGVKAHELQEVIPYAVTGEKDAEQMQSVDYSKLVPILVQAIQELKQEIEILKQK